MAETTEPPQKKRRRIFPWFFLAVQAAFIAWIIGGVAGSGTGNCEGLDPQACAGAEAVGTGIGVALIIGLWAAVDIILGITWLVVRRR